MFRYQLIQDDPEGIEWVRELMSEKKYTQKEFKELMETAICAAFEEQMKSFDVCVFKSQVDDEILEQKLLDLGFKSAETGHQARYVYSPFDYEPGEKMSKLFAKIEEHRNRPKRK